MDYPFAPQYTNCLLCGEALDYTANGKSMPPEELDDLKTEAKRAAEFRKHLPDLPKSERADFEADFVDVGGERGQFAVLLPELFRPTV